jgi:putative phage-type endonuclease
MSTAIAQALPDPLPTLQLTDYETRDRWLAARTKGIGASDSSALFGQSPWHTKLSLWAEKTGRLQHEGGDGEWLDWGNLLEPLIADRYAAVTGSTIWQGSPFCIARHSTIPILLATPDRMVISSPGRATRGTLQIKNAAAFKSHDWEEGPPVHVQIQVQHEMSVLGLEWSSVAVLIGGNRFRHFEVERNPEFIAELEAQAVAFWRLVETGSPPSLDEIDGRALETLARLHPADDGTEVPLPSEAIAIWEELTEIRASLSAAEKRKKDADAKLRALIGSATFGRLPDGRRLSLKTTARSGFAVDPTTYRSLKLEKGKRP